MKFCVSKYIWKIIFVNLLVLTIFILPALSVEKNITYMQILQKPRDLDLNLKYAQQQGKMGNYKQTISTLERLTMLYPDNIEIKLYLLSVLVQIDSPDKARSLIEEMKLRTDLQSEDLETLQEIEQDLKDKEPGLWNFNADINIASLILVTMLIVLLKQENKVRKVKLQNLHLAMFDKTTSGGISISATRPIGEESSFLANISHTTSNQHQEHDDDFQSYGLTLGLDTVLGGQSLSPYFTVSKSDYHTDADSFSTGMGIGGFFTVGERHSFSYGYAFSDTKGNHNHLILLHKIQTQLVMVIHLIMIIFLLKLFLHQLV